MRNMKAIGTWCGVASMTLGIAAMSGCKGMGKSSREARELVREKHNGSLASLAAQTAQQDFRVGNLDSALEGVQQAIALQPEHPEHYVLRGRILIEKNDLRNARSSFQAALALDDTIADAHYYSGLVHQRWNDHAAARDAYQQAYDLDPSSEPYALAYIESLMTLQQFDDALAFFEATSNEFENLPAFRRTEGHLHLMLGDPHAAAEAFYQAMLLDPDNIANLESLVYAYIKAGDHVRAQYHLDQILDDPTQAGRRDLRHVKARCLVAIDRLIEAREIYIKLATEDRSDPTIWFELGNVALKLGDLRRAEESARTLISMWPASAKGYLVRGQFYRASDKQGKALRDFETAADLDPQSEAAWIYLGMMRESLGRTDEAVAAYQQALAINPDSPFATRLMSGFASVDTDSP